MISDETMIDELNISSYRIKWLKNHYINTISDLNHYLKYYGIYYFYGMEHYCVNKVIEFITEIANNGIHVLSAITDHINSLNKGISDLESEKQTERMEKIKLWSEFLETLRNNSSETNIKTNIESNTETLISTSSKQVSYPQNLLDDIFEGLDFKPKEITHDIYLGISYALVTLEERERTMILLRYEQNATLEKVGNRYGLSGERARQIIHKAIRKLRHPSRFQIINEGFQGYIRHREQSYYKSGFNDGYNKAKKDLFNAFTKIMSLADEYKTDNNITCNYTLEDLDLSLRSYHCLKRAGNNNISDLLKYETEDDIMKIRNLGAKCAKEVAAKLFELGTINGAWRCFLD